MPHGLFKRGSQLAFNVVAVKQVNVSLVCDVRVGLSHLICQHGGGDTLVDHDRSVDVHGCCYLVDAAIGFCTRGIVVWGLEFRCRTTRPPSEGREARDASTDGRSAE